MRKLLVLALLFLLVACGAPQVTDTITDTDTIDEADQSVESTSVSEAKPESQAPKVSADPITPSETPAEAGVIRDRDWIKGAEDPLITIIEYGDFQ